jgi:hypothetical protein
MLRCQITNRFDLNVRAFDRGRSSTAKQIRIYPDRKKLGIESSVLRPRGIQVAVRKLLLQIDMFINQTLRRISVHVHDDCAAMNRKWVSSNG